MFKFILKYSIKKRENKGEEGEGIKEERVGNQERGERIKEERGSKREGEYTRERIKEEREGIKEEKKRKKESGCPLLTHRARGRGLRPGRGPGGTCRRRLRVAGVMHGQAKEEKGVVLEVWV